MKFIFSESHTLPWNGYTARYERGISGTHSASMYLAEALAELNHEVIFVNICNKIIPGNHLGVKYVNFNEFEVCDCDYIITTYHTNDLFIIDKINNFNKIIIIMNNPLCTLPYDGKNYLYKIDASKVIIAFISEFSKNNILLYPDSNLIKSFEHMLLYNSIDLNDIKSDEKDNNFIFFACLDRGFKMATQIINKFDINNSFKLYTNTYSDCNNDIYQNLNKNVFITENTSKNTILNYCAKGKYFLYPLINLDTNSVHYDCAPYVVLESLLSGVVVIAPKMKLFVELYGDAVCYIDTSDIIPEKDLTTVTLDSNTGDNIHPNFGYPILNRYVAKLKLLEENIDLYNSYVEKGRLLKDKYSNKNVVNTLINAIDVDFNLNLNTYKNIEQANQYIYKKNISTNMKLKNPKLMHNKLLNKYK